MLNTEKAEEIKAQVHAIANLILESVDERDGYWIDEIIKHFTPVLSDLTAQLAEARATLDKFTNTMSCDLLTAAKLIDACAERDRLKAVNQRLHDLVRYKRHELFNDGLITQDEYTEIMQDHPAVARLEGYDKMRNELADVKAKHDALAIGAYDILRTGPYALYRQPDITDDRFNEIVSEAVTKILGG